MPPRLFLGRGPASTPAQLCRVNRPAGIDSAGASVAQQGPGSRRLNLLRPAVTCSDQLVGGVDRQGNPRWRDLSATWWTALKPSQPAAAEIGGRRRRRGSGSTPEGMPLLKRIFQAAQDRLCSPGILGIGSSMPGWPLGHVGYCSARWGHKRRTGLPGQCSAGSRIVHRAM